MLKVKAKVSMVKFKLPECRTKQGCKKCRPELRICEANKYNKSLRKQLRQFWMEDLK